MTRSFDVCLLSVFLFVYLYACFLWVGPECIGCMGRGVMRGYVHLHIWVSLKLEMQFQHFNNKQHAHTEKKHTDTH